MHGDDIGARQVTWDPEKLRNMHNIATQTFDEGAKLPVTPDGAVRLKQWDDLEICRQITDLRGSSRRTDQKVLTGAIDLAECPHDVSCVGTNPKFGSASDINRDLHGLI